jgi:O-acetyl-ADP-ribose deacetylase (regulator of RNase III)
LTSLKKKDILQLPAYLPEATMKILIGTAVLELVEGDITQQTVDAIVNAANTTLLGGGGVDGAIHRAGGPTILEECRKVGGCSTGEAVITTGGNLPAKRVIHTVGPIWHGGSHREPELLQSAYNNALIQAEQNKLLSIAFPSISTGAYRFPMDKASRIALSTIIDYLKGTTTIKAVRFVLFGRAAREAYEKTLHHLCAHDKDIERV